MTRRWRSPYGRCFAATHFSVSGIAASCPTTAARGNRGRSSNGSDRGKHDLSKILPPGPATKRRYTTNEGPQTPHASSCSSWTGLFSNSASIPKALACSTVHGHALYANDPAAFRSVCPTQLQQQVTQQTGQYGRSRRRLRIIQGLAGACSAGNAERPCTANPTIPALSSSNQDTGTNQALGKGSNQTSGNGATATGNNIFIQFEELQVAFATAGQDQTQDQTPAQGSPLLPQGQVLSVTA